MSFTSPDTTNQHCYISLQSVRSDTQWHFSYRPQLLTVCSDSICVQHCVLLVKQTLDYFSKHKTQSPKANSHQRPLPQTVRAGTVCVQSTQRPQKQFTDAQYEKRLVYFPANWYLTLRYEFCTFCCDLPIIQTILLALCVPTLLSARTHWGCSRNVSSDTTHILTTINVSLAASCQ